MQKVAKPIDAQVGARVRMHRRMLRLTQGDLANALGITVSDVHVPFAKIWRDGLQRVGATDCKSVDQRVANR